MPRITDNERIAAIVKQWGKDGLEQAILSESVMDLVDAVKELAEAVKANRTTRLVFPGDNCSFGDVD